MQRSLGGRIDITKSNVKFRSVIADKLVSLVVL
jgi:hypothetical protein